ncbi:conserved Plasmodium protein, unknown function [Plasmodium ovale curtisi]|uniref:Uncharacterized protein n=1 Tax=Plasmodium ovale curtisi TaxID=864141 RepID=A0A1A8VR36_PLAOA|nr:conserved Plasmodium protein, unknown function [Plasmodium ovale curtisi]
MSEYHFYNNVIPSKSIRTAICTDIKGNNKKYMVYASNNYLNVCSVDRDGFTDDYSKHVVFSEVLELREYMPEKLVDRIGNGNMKSYIFLLTRKYNLLLLEFSLKNNDFITLSQVNLREVNGIHIEEDITFLLDERHRTLLFYGYKNILKYIYLDYDDYFNLSNLYTLRLDEGLIIDMVFLGNGDASGAGGCNAGDNEMKFHDSKKHHEGDNHLEGDCHLQGDHHLLGKCRKKKKKRSHGVSSDIDNSIKEENRGKFLIDRDMVETAVTKNKICFHDSSSECCNYYTNEDSTYADSGLEHWGFTKTDTRLKSKREQRKLEVKTELGGFSSGKENERIAPPLGHNNNTQPNDYGGPHEKGAWEKNQADCGDISIWKKNKKDINATICILYDAKKKESYVYERYIRLVSLHSLSEKKRMNAPNEVASAGSSGNSGIGGTCGNGDNDGNGEASGSRILPMYYKPVMVDSSINKLLCFAKNRMLLIGFQFINYINLEADQDKSFFLSSELRTIRCIECISTKRYILADDYGDLFILTCLCKSKSPPRKSLHSVQNDGIASGGVSSDDIANNGIVSIRLQFIGTCSRSNVIVSIFSDILFLGSQVSDSYLLRMHNYPFYEYEEHAPVEPTSDFTLNDSHSLRYEKYDGKVFTDNSNSINSDDSLHRFGSATKESSYGDRDSNGGIDGNGDRNGDGKGNWDRKRSNKMGLERMQKGYNPEEDCPSSAQAQDDSVNRRGGYAPSSDVCRERSRRGRRRSSQNRNMYDDSNCVEAVEGMGEQKGRKRNVTPYDEYKDSGNNSTRNYMHVKTYGQMKSVGESCEKYTQHCFLNEKENQLVHMYNTDLYFCVVKNKHNEKEIITCNSYGRTGCISIIRNGLKTNIISNLNFHKLTNIFVVKYVVYLKKKNTSVDENNPFSKVLCKREKINSYDDWLDNNINTIPHILNNEKEKTSIKPNEDEETLEFQAFAYLGNKRNVEIKHVDLCFLNKYFFENVNEINVLKFSNFIYFHVFIICLTYGFHTKVLGVCTDASKATRKLRMGDSVEEWRETDSEKDTMTGIKTDARTDTRTDSQRDNRSSPPFDWSYDKDGHNEIHLCEYEHTDIDLSGNTMYFNVLKNFPYLVQVTNKQVRLLCCLSLKLVCELTFSFIFNFCVYSDYFYIYCERCVKVYVVGEKSLLFLHQHEFSETVSSMVVYKGLMACVFRSREVVLYNIDRKKLSEIRNFQKGKTSGGEAQGGTIFTQVSLYKPQCAFFVFITDIELVDMNENVYLFIGYNNGDVEHFLLCTSYAKNGVNIQGTELSDNPNIGKILTEGNISPTSEVDKQRCNDMRSDMQSDVYSDERARVKKSSHSNNPNLDNNPQERKNNPHWGTGFMHLKSPPSSDHTDEEKQFNREEFMPLNRRRKKRRNNLLKLHKEFLKKKEAALKCVYRKGELGNSVNTKFTYKIRIIDNIEKERKIKKCKRKMLKYLSVNHTDILKHFDFSKGTFTNIHNLHKACTTDKQAEVNIHPSTFYNVNVYSKSFHSIEKLLARMHGNNLGVEETGQKDWQRREEHEERKKCYDTGKFVHTELTSGGESLIDASLRAKTIGENRNRGKKKGSTLNKRTRRNSNKEEETECVPINDKTEESRNRASVDTNICSEHVKVTPQNISISALKTRKGKEQKRRGMKINRKKATYFFQFFQIYGMSSEESSDNDIVSFSTFRRAKGKKSHKRRDTDSGKDEEREETFDLQGEVTYNSALSLSSDSNLDSKNIYSASLEGLSACNEGSNSELGIDACLHGSNARDVQNEKDKMKMKQKLKQTQERKNQTKERQKQTQKRQSEQSEQSLQTGKNSPRENKVEPRKDLKRHSNDANVKKTSKGVNPKEETILEVMQDDIGLKCNTEKRNHAKRRKDFINEMFKKKLKKQCDEMYLQQTYKCSGKCSNDEESSSDIFSTFDHFNNVVFDEKIYLKRYIMKSKNILLSNRRKINACKSPIKFKKFLKAFSEKTNIDININNNPVKKYNFLFICCENPMIIFSDIKKKITISKISQKDMYLVELFNDFDYLNPFHNFRSFKKKKKKKFYFLYFDGFNINISHINDIKDIYMEKIPFHRTVEKIAYHNETGLLVTACPLEEKYKTNKMMKQIVCFFDPFQNSVKYTYIVPSKYSVSSICIYEVNKDVYTNSIVNTFIFVGTANINERITEPCSGNIYIFIAKKKTNVFEIKHIYTYNVNCGGITHLKQFYDKLVAAVNNTVVILDISNLLINLEKYVDLANRGIKMEKDDAVLEVASFTPSSWIMSLDVLENYVVVGDIMTSSLLNEVCRDYSNVWCTSVCALSKSHFLVSDMESNFIVLQKSNIRFNDEDSFKLSMVSLFNHGSVVNKMLPTSLTSLIEEEEVRNTILWKKDSILCASSEGSISAVIPFSNFAHFKRALCIEIALNDNITSIGNLSHSSYREYKVSFASKCCKGVVDGELFKMFFYLPFEKQFKTYIYAKWIAKKLNCKFGSFENFMLDIENLCSFL